MVIITVQDYMLIFGEIVGANNMKKIIDIIINFFKDVKDTVDNSYLIDDAYMELGIDEKLGRCQDLDDEEE